MKIPMAKCSQRRATFGTTRCQLLKKSIIIFKNHIHRPLIAITLAAFLMVMHNYFNNELILFISIWLFVNVSDGQTDDELEIETQPNQI